MSNRVRAELSKSKKDSNSFLIMALDVPKFPEGIKRADFFSGLAIIAINESGEYGQYSGVELSQREKLAVYKQLHHVEGIKLGETFVGVWIWCNLYEKIEDCNSCEYKLPAVAVGHCCVVESASRIRHALAGKGCTAYKEDN